MPTTCLINFENPDGVYFAGELLRGTAILTLTKAKKVRGIYVRIFGRAYAHWTRYCSIDHNPGRDENGKLVRRGGHRVSYTGSEVCFSIENCTKKIQRKNYNRKQRIEKLKLSILSYQSSLTSTIFYNFQSFSLFLIFGFNLEIGTFS